MGAFNTTDLISFLGLIVTVLIAVGGYTYQHYKDRSQRKRQHNLELVNKRLEEFYGPLYFRTISGRKAYDLMLDEFNVKQASELSSPQDLESWRSWYESVFHPYNLGLEDIIINKSYLILEKEAPKSLTDFISNVTLYKVMIENWKNGKYDNHFPSVSFPVDLKDYVEEKYLFLKDEQVRLSNG